MNRIARSWAPGWDGRCTLAVLGSWLERDAASSGQEAKAKGLHLSSPHHRALAIERHLSLRSLSDDVVYLCAM